MKKIFILGFVFYTSFCQFSVTNNIPPVADTSNEDWENKFEDAFDEDANYLAKGAEAIVNEAESFGPGTIFITMIIGGLLQKTAEGTVKKITKVSEKTWKRIIKRVQKKEQLTKSEEKIINNVLESNTTMNQLKEALQKIPGIDQNDIDELFKEFGIKVATLQAKKEYDDKVKAIKSTYKKDTKQ